MDESFVATSDPVNLPTRIDSSTATANAAARRRNIVFLLLDTGLFMFALALVDMSSVIPTLLAHLTTHPVFIGLLGTVQAACWLLPQLLVARLVAARTRKLPIVIFATSASRAGWLVLFAALLWPGGLPTAITLGAAYISLAIFWTFDGVSALAWFDVIARAVPANLRGRMFGMMSLSSVFGVAGGFVVQRVLGSVEFPYPTDFQVLLAVALVFLAVGVVPLFLVVEPLNEGAAPPTEPIGQYLRRLPGLLRDRPNFRRLVTVQLLVGAASLAVPFYAPFGVIELGLAESSIGSFVIGITVGSMVGGFVWGYLGDHGLKDEAIRWIAFIGLLAPLLALGLRYFAAVLPPTILPALLALSLFFVGCSTRSNWVAFSNYVMEIAEPRERPILIGLMNTLNGTLAIAPPLGGLLAGRFGYEATFALALVPIAIGLLLSFGLRLDGASFTTAPS